ncbi:MAG: hypothetical protein KF901_04940 [Myxococcales bacterium]|nr:hypothetical protein [Myxococcales bacterium]
MTTRTMEERFWLHPLLCSRLTPPNREARRVIEARRPGLRKKLGRLVERANARRPADQLKLTVDEAEKLAEDLMSSALARAQAHCAALGLPAVEIFAVVVMSNHIHLVVRARGKNLAAFMSYFLARVAQSVNLLLGRTGPVFPRRYDAQPILDEAAVAARVRYVLENPKKAGLVRSFDEWPGFLAVAGLHDDDELTTTFFDRTAWQRAKRPVDRAPFWRTRTLTLSRLPGMESVATRAYLATLKAWCDSPPAPQCLGVGGVLDTDVHQRPKQPKRSYRPYAFGTREQIDAHRRETLLRYTAYDEARDRLARGEPPLWPEGMYAPGGAVAA